MSYVFTVWQHRISTLVYSFALEAQVALFDYLFTDLYKNAPSHCKTQLRY